MEVGGIWNNSRNIPYNESQIGTRWKADIQIYIYIYSIIYIYIIRNQNYLQNIKSNYNL